MRAMEVGSRLCLFELVCYFEGNVLKFGCFVGKSLKMNFHVREFPGMALKNKRHSLFGFFEVCAVGMV